MRGGRGGGEGQNGDRGGATNARRKALPREDDILRAAARRASGGPRAGVASSAPTASAPAAARLPTPGPRGVGGRASAAMRPCRGGEGDDGAARGRRRRREIARLKP